MIGMILLHFYLQRIYLSASISCAKVRIRVSSLLRQSPSKRFAVSKKSASLKNRLAEKKVVDGVGRMNGGRRQKSISSSLFGCCNRCCRHVYSLLRRCTVMIDGLDDENRICTRFLFFSLALSLFFPRDSFPDELPWW